ncbi:hypothetical protein HK100_009810 [Physocladia obscura]|uniref:Uncharacterized protein n=1 Tax=Physocladia obscura TaxID=109957 RepID=A0AAD5SMS6_9FUNG|nr:hypothetical protein HK100_009810 [Physocladia obscura]
MRILGLLGAQNAQATKVAILRRVTGGPQTISAHQLGLHFQRAKQPWASATATARYLSTVPPTQSQTQETKAKAEAAAAEPQSQAQQVSGFWSKKPAETWNTDHASSIPLTLPSAVDTPVVVAFSSSTSSNPPKSTPTSTNASESTSESNGSGNARSHGSRFFLGVSVAAAIIAAGAFAIDSRFNAHPPPPKHSLFKRDAIHTSEYLRKYINETFGYVGAACGVTAVSAYLFSISPFATHLKHPLVLIGTFAVLGVLTNATLLAPSHERHKARILASSDTTDSAHTNISRKHLLLAATAIAKGAFVASTVALSPALLTRVALDAGVVVAAISFVASTAKSDHYINVGGPLLAGLSVTTLEIVGPLILPAASLGLPLYQIACVYGGIAWFSYCVLRDTGKMVANGEKVQNGTKERDIVNEALRLYLDIMNVF